MNNLGCEAPRAEEVETDSEGDEEGDEVELRRARRRQITPGQRFRLRLMDVLFDVHTQLYHGVTRSTIMQCYYGVL